MHYQWINRSLFAQLELVHIVIRQTVQRHKVRQWAGYRGPNTQTLTAALNYITVYSQRSTFVTDILNAYRREKDCTSRCCPGQKANQTPDSHLADTATTAGAAADKAPNNLLTRKPNTGSWPIAIDNRHLEPSSSGISAWDGPTNNSRHWRHQGSNVPVPAAVSGSPTGKCGLLPQHFHHRINAAAVLLASLRCFFRLELSTERLKF